MAVSVFVGAHLTESVLHLQGTVTLDVDADTLTLSADAQTVTLLLTTPQQLSHVFRLYRQVSGRYRLQAATVMQVLSPYTLIITLPSHATLTVMPYPARRWLPFSVSTPQKAYWLSVLPTLLWRTFR